MDDDTDKGQLPGDQSPTDYYSDDSMDQEVILEDEEEEP